MGWHDWAELTGDKASRVSPYRFDSHGCALTAAVMGLGVVLASLPLAQTYLANGQLVSLSKLKLEPASGPWLTTGEEQLSKLDWQALKERFCVN